MVNFLDFTSQCGFHQENCGIHQEGQAAQQNQPGTKPRRAEAPEFSIQKWPSEILRF